jgi:hypothetical protein
MNQGGKEVSKMKITVHDDRLGSQQLSVDEMAALAPSFFPLAHRVPEAGGEAFDLKQWFSVWAGDRTQEQPTYFMVEASDEFQATIPWNQLDHAAILYTQDGLPLQKGYPIRLYVPDGSSSCLNVKSVVKMFFRYDDHIGSAATFGFKNQVTVDELRKR